MLNSTVLVGRLVNDPQQFTSNGGNNVCKFSLAYTQGVNADGTDDTGFIECISFKGVAEVVLNHLSKGDKIALIGSLRHRKYEKQDGSKGSTFEILVNSIEFVDVIKFQEQPEEPKPTEKPVAKPTRTRR